MRRQLDRAMEQRKKLELSSERSDWKKLRRDWCWEPKEFREELLELIAGKQGKQHHGEESKDLDKPKARWVLGERLRRAGWTESELGSLWKGDAKKARMAARSRAGTPMNWSWIDRQLEMGHWRTRL